MAMTFVPLLSTVTLKTPVRKDDAGDPFGGRWYRFYRDILGTALRCQYRFVLIVVVIFALAVGGMSLVRQANR